MLDRQTINNVANTNGTDIKCLKCGEYTENIHIVEEFTDKELNRFVVLDYHYDDPDNDDEKTRISALNGCDCCEVA